MRSRDYGRDVLAPAARTRPAPPPEVELEADLVVEEVATGFCGAVVGTEHGGVTLEDRHGARRVFPLEPGAFLLEGRRVTLVRPRRAMPAAPARTASGSLAVAGHRARVARASRIYVEGVHDAALVERVWGDDLRIEGVVVESLDGVDELPGVVEAFRPGPGRRLGVLVDHLVAGSKESRIAAAVAGEHVLITGHPYIDIWQAVKPASIGIPAWPRVPRGEPWKEGVCRALGVAEPGDLWRRVLASVDSYTDLEVGLLGAVERLIDFVAA
ncbi:Protein of unknown function (DUF3097) [Frankia torreyi]|uniref:DUF3097 domain-containing protein n=1 Tax=Frankia torreyi TaxID=1856 RepID=A0A0D8BKU5_9ACTN|nr:MULTISPECIES: DUF3097 domain-containing protein [Frankia]KJE24756.1 Protein of unknown function (DUF3097) [Frankia torreyi]KQC39161.1 hypothetical protein UK82_05720 [Frankia sp. ACN1ag]KQM07075.1 Protein of unknown function (DUF3097) [Frankia sp. CpI1-P]